MSGTHPHLINIYDNQWKMLRSLASKTGLSASEHIRRLIDIASPAHSQVLSGAQVLGVQVCTTSGNVWIGRGY